MSFGQGQGMAHSYSWKQKINTKSPTEAELVRVDNLLGYILWAHYFVQGQGYGIDPSLLYQDSMSAILLWGSTRLYDNWKIPRQSMGDSIHSLSHV
jgi:hypothetical protein